MVFTLALAQTKHPQDGDTTALVARVAHEAAEAGADILVFPESLMSRYELERGAFLAQSQPIDGAFSFTIESIAAREGLWILYTMNELNEGAGASEGSGEGSAEQACPFNTAVLVDNLGVRRGVYRKVHLFDTDFTKESSRMSAGDTLFKPIETPFGRIGMAICYDLRFPEVARFAAERGADLLVYPAAWVDGPNKALQWQTLLAARAIENQIYVAGVSRCDEGYVGSSAVYAPDGRALAQAGREERLVLCELDCKDLLAMREKMPILSHRRPELYK